MHGTGSPVSGEDLGPGCGRSVKPEAESQEQRGWGVGEVARIWVWDLGAGGGGKSRLRDQWIWRASGPQKELRPGRA